MSQNEQESVTITRSLSNLKAMYITFVGEKPDIDTGIFQMIKFCNNFYHPMASSLIAQQNEYATLLGRGEGRLDWPVRYFNRLYDSARELSYNISVGAKQFQIFEVRSNAEAFYHLEKCLGQQSSKFSGLDITADQYYNHTFIIGQNFETAGADASWSGLNTKMGDTVCVRIKNAAPEADRPTRMYITLVGEQILNVGDSGCTVFD